MSLGRLHDWHNTLFKGGYWGICKIKIASLSPATTLANPLRSGASRARKDEMINFLNFLNKDSENAYIKALLPIFGLPLSTHMMTATDAWQGLWRTTAWQMKALSHFLSLALFTQTKKIIMKF